jgi:hypothetical protein
VSENPKMIGKLSFVTNSGLRDKYRRSRKTHKDNDKGKKEEYYFSSNTFVFDNV